MHESAHFHTLTFVSIRFQHANQGDWTKHRNPCTPTLVLTLMLEWMTAVEMTFSCCLLVMMMTVVFVIDWMSHIHGNVFVLWCSLVTL